MYDLARLYTNSRSCSKQHADKRRLINGLPNEYLLVFEGQYATFECNCMATAMLNDATGCDWHNGAPAQSMHIINGRIGGAWIIPHPYGIIIPRIKFEDWI